jgi:hypothetical protein
MKILLTVFIIFISGLRNDTIAKEVYICDSTKAEVYHKTKDCEGLTNCTHEIKIVSVYDAKHTYNRRACKVCYFWVF